MNYVSSLTGTNFGFLCERTMDVTAQDGGEVSGSTSWKGGGATSDAHCSHLGAFIGTVELDGTVTLRMSQPVEARDCRRLSGDDVFTGLVGRDSRRMEGRMTDRVSCVDLSGQTFEADRTVTFSVTRIGT